MPTNRKLKRGYANSVKRIAGKYERQSGWIGKSATEIQTGLSDFIYVRLVNNTIVKAINKLAPLIYNFPVVISRNESNAYWEVVEIRQPYGGTALEQIKDHHGQHEYPARDTVWVRQEQFLPLLVLAAGGMNVFIYGGVIENGGQKYLIENQTLDLESYIPATGAVWAVLYSTDGTLSIDTTATGESRENLSIPDIPSVPGASLCAISLYSGQTEIKRDASRNDFVDLRFIRTAGGLVNPENNQLSYFREYVYANDVSSDDPHSCQIRIDGALSAIAGVGNVIIQNDGEIESIAIHLEDKGSASSTIVDVNLNGVTIFTNQDNRPTMAYDESGDVIIAFPDVINVYEGDILSFDIDQISTGADTLTAGAKVRNIVPISFVTDEDGELVFSLENLEEA